MNKKILIVDDDEKLRTLLKEYLEDYEFEVQLMEDGTHVLEKIQIEPPDMVILDIMLPGKNGLDILKEIRSKHAVPVVMLTAKGEDTDRIVGLELGADDYMPKPFNPRELLARIKAIWRRTGLNEPGSTDQADSLILKTGGLELNRSKQSVTIRTENREIMLSSTECRLLEALMAHPNHVLSRERLMDLARGKDFMAFDRSIDVHISKLRAKLEPEPRSPRWIKTIWGTGYMFADTP